MVGRKKTSVKSVKRAVKHSRKTLSPSEVMHLQQQGRYHGGSYMLSHNGRVKYGGAWWNSWGDLWSGVKNTARDAWDYVKKNKIISKGATDLGFPMAGKVIDALGAGRRRGGAYVPAIKV